MHADTAWALKFQVCFGYTFTPATLSDCLQVQTDRSPIYWPNPSLETQLCDQEEEPKLGFIYMAKVYNTVFGKYTSSLSSKH
jgi:hypothetical protein